MNTALASNKNIPIVEAKVQTKNIAGPPVYYPPGKELFTKSEAQAAWKAGVSKSKPKPNTRSLFACVHIFNPFQPVFLYSSLFRVATAKVAVNMSMKRRANRKVQVNLVRPSFQSVCHYAVPCHARSCKSSTAAVAAAIQSTMPSCTQLLLFSFILFTNFYHLN